MKSSENANNENNVLNVPSSARLIIEVSPSLDPDPAASYHISLFTFMNE
jgi:hypothetical protein